VQSSGITHQVIIIGHYRGRGTRTACGVCEKVASNHRSDAPYFAFSSLIIAQVENAVYKTPPISHIAYQPRYLLGEIIWYSASSLFGQEMMAAQYHCSISFNSYGHASHGRKSTQIFVSHCITEPTLALAELAELRRALPAGIN
jgi:hypothetical protein